MIDKLVSCRSRHVFELIKSSLLGCSSSPYPYTSHSFLLVSTFRLMAPSRRAYNTRRFSLRLHRYPQSYRDELFAPCLHMQATSPNPVLYDRRQGAVAEFP
jgi:hypothetical protein